MDKNESDKAILKELAREQLRTHAGRNAVMGIAIMLTAILLSFVFTAGFNFMVTMQDSSEAAPGPGEDGAVIGTEEQFIKIQKMDIVEWADFVQRCSLTALKNDAFIGIQTELLAPDEGFYQHNKIAIQTGKYPEKETDILISDTLANRLKIEQAGKKLDIQVMIESESKQEEKTIEMEVCGIYQNPIRNLSDSYEEIYTVSEFIDQYNPKLREDQNYIYVKLNHLNPLAMKSDVYQILNEIKKEVGADYVTTKNYNNFYLALISLIPILLLVLLIMLSGYFLIYNVFSISLALDVKWFGLMKTIGTTQKQLKYIYHYQILLISAAGMVGGIIIGYLLGHFCAPSILSMTSFASFYRSANPIGVILVTVVFTWITVWRGVSRVVKKAASLSAIEAAKYVPHRRKKTITVISFALSGIILIVVGNAVFGYQVSQMVERYNQEDYKIWHKASFWELEEAYQPISSGICERLRQLPFVKQVDVIYKAKTSPDEIDIGGMKYYEPFLGEVCLDGKLKTELEAMRYYQENVKAWNLLDNGNVKMQISGIPVNRLEKELTYCNIVEGKIDTNLFAQGNYILYQTPGRYGTGDKVSTEDKIHAGDILNLQFYDDKKDCFVLKSMEVMAVTEWKDPYGTGNISSSNIVMIDNLFKEIYSGYEDNIAAMEIKMKHELETGEMEAIMNIVQSEHNMQINVDSRNQDYEKYIERKKSIVIIGVFFSVVLGMIGISNLINTLVMDTIFRKNQIAVLQSIGMTKTQLRKMLFVDYMKLGFIAIGIILIVGKYAATVITASSTFTGFNISIFLEIAVGILFFIVALSGGLAWILTEWLNRKTVVERLRENE